MLEVIDRGQKITVYRDPLWVPGRMQATITVHDQHFYSAGWVAVQETMYADGLGGFAAKADQMRHVLRVGDDGSRRWHPDRADLSKYVSFGRPQYWTGAAWADLPLSGGVRSGNVITWDRPNFTLRILITWRKVLFSLTLKSAAAARRFRFPVSLNNLGWDNWKVTAGGLTVATVSAETAVDANGVEIPVIRSYSGGYVEYSADLSGAAFPVTLTPLNDTFTDGPSGDVTSSIDTMLQQQSPTTGYATDVGIHTRTSATQARTGLIKYNVSSLAGVTVDSASHSLFVIDAGQAGEISYGKAILVANDGWTEASATWNTKDGTNAWAGDTGADGGTDAGCSVSGTDYAAATICTHTTTANAGDEVASAVTASAVQAWVDGANYGLALLPGSSTITAWHSSDSVTAAYRPKLVVVYTAAGGAPAAGVPFGSLALMGVGR